MCDRELPRSVTHHHLDWYSAHVFHAPELALNAFCRGRRWSTDFFPQIVDLSDPPACLTPLISVIKPAGRLQPGRLGSVSQEPIDVLVSNLGPRTAVSFGQTPLCLLLWRSEPGHWSAFRTKIGTLRRAFGDWRTRLLQTRDVNGFSGQGFQSETTGMTPR